MTPGSPSFSMIFRIFSSRIRKPRESPAKHRDLDSLVLVSIPSRGNFFTRRGANEGSGDPGSPSKFLIL
jgi:hypothetical protein